MPHMHPCPKILHLHHIQVSRHAPHLHPGPVPPASRSQGSHLASLHVASHFYVDLTISVPRIAFLSRSHPTYTRSPDVPHLHLGPVSLLSKSQYPRLISIQVTSRLPSRSRQLHITSIQVPSHHKPRPDMHVSSPTRSQYSCLTIQVTSHLNLHSANCILASSRSHLIPSRSQCLCLTSIKAQYHSHPYLKICISPASR